MAGTLCKACGGTGRSSDPARSVCPECVGSGQLTVRPETQAVEKPEKPVAKKRSSVPANG